MRKLIAFLVSLMLAAPVVASGPIFSNSGGIGSATSIFSGSPREPTGGTYNIDGTTGRADFPVVASRVLSAYNTGYGATTRLDGGCSNWSSQGHANWNVFQTCLNENPTELQVYSAASQGIAYPNGTNQLIRIRGTPFTASWVGRCCYYFNGTGFRVSAVSDADHLTVQTTAGGAVTWGATGAGNYNTYFFTTTSVNAVVNVTGTTVNYVSGQPFIPFFNTASINGSSVTATFISPTQMTLAAPLSLTGASFRQDVNIANELTNMRLQSLAGVDEENFVITQTPGGPIFQTAYAGQGRYRPMIFGVGELPTGTLNGMMEMRPNDIVGQPGFVTLGGLWSQGSYASLFRTGQNWVNHWEFAGNTTGGTPFAACRGTDAAVGCNFDVQGAQTITFSSHTFGSTEFQIFGVGGAAWLATASGATPSLSAQGPGANYDIQLNPKGSGSVVASGGLKLPSYTVATLPTCNSGRSGVMAYATDLLALTYAAVVTGGGAFKAPVACDGTNWTMH